jgi:hypothetical protein
MKNRNELIDMTSHQNPFLPYKTKVIRGNGTLFIKMTLNSRKYKVSWNINGQAPAQLT